MYKIHNQEQKRIKPTPQKKVVQEKQPKCKNYIKHEKPVTNCTLMSNLQLSAKCNKCKCIPRTLIGGIKCSFMAV
jgi:predicted HTH transcriptional regulator